MEILVSREEPDELPPADWTRTVEASEMPPKETTGP